MIKMTEFCNARRIDSLMDILRNEEYKKRFEKELLKRDKIKNEKCCCCHCGKQLGEPHDLIDTEIISSFSITEVNLCHQCAIRLDNIIMDFCDMPWRLWGKKHDVFGRTYQEKRT